MHHREIRQHVVIAKERPKRDQRLGDRTATFYDLAICRCGGFVPLPRILKGFVLSCRSRAALFGEQAGIRFEATGTIEKLVAGEFSGAFSRLLSLPRHR